MSPFDESAEGLGAAPVGVLTVDRLLIVRTWSAWLESATGTAAADVRGRALADVVPELAARGLLERFRGVLATGEAYVLAPAFHHYLIPCPPRQPSGHFTQMQQLVTLGALRDGDAVVGVMATIEDVTARLEAERDLARDLRSADPAVRQQAAGRLAAAESLHGPAAFTDVLRQGDWQVRRTAVQGMMRHASRDLLASLITALRDEHHDFNVLSSALQLLSMIDVDVTQPLTELLKDPSPDVRMQAALALGEHPHAAAVGALVEALADSDINVRFHAIEALGRLRAPQAVSALADLAESRDFFLAFAAIDALVNIADPAVAGRLLPLLDDETLAAPAAEALGALGGGEVVRPLVRVLDRPAAPVRAVVKAVAALYATYEGRYGGGAYIAAEFRAAITPAGAQQILDATPQGTKEELQGLVLLLGWLPGTGVERALAALLGRPDLRAEVIEALVGRGSSVVEVLLEQLEQDDLEVRLAAVVALGRLGDSRATTGLCELLDDDRSLAIAVACALAGIGDPRALEPLLRVLGHPDAAVRQAVIGALNSIGHPDMARHVQRLLGSADPATRESAVRIAGYFGYPECAETVFSACADTEEAVRRAALEHIALFDEERALPVLLEAVRRDTPRARAAAATGLGRILGDEARDALHLALADPDVWVRYFAARALGQHEQGSSLDPLAAAASTDRAIHVRLAALESIGRIAGPRATGLLARYMDDEVTEVAVAALEALGHVRDAEATALLGRALRSLEPARRAAAARALTMRADEESVSALAWTASADTSEEVLQAAVEGLARVAAHGSGAFAPAVDALVELTREPARREMAVAALARASAAHLDRVAAALGHASPDVRRAMIDVLTRSRHGDASLHLCAALDHEDAAVREAAVMALDRVGARGLSGRFAAMAAGDSDAAVRRAANAVVAREPGKGGDERGRG